MQNAELFRRGIVVPLDQHAEDDVRNENVSDLTNVKHLSIVDDEIFYTLWTAGLFHQINMECGSLLGDYEEELIEVESVPMIITAINSVMSRLPANNKAIHRFLSDAEQLIEYAVTHSRPVLFVL